MKVAINKTKYQVKTSANLTCREYIEYNKRHDNTILDYLAITTKQEYKSIADTSFDMLTLNRLNSYIQPLKLVEHLERSYLFRYTKTGQIVSAKTFNFESVGTVFLIQSKAQETKSNLELMIYLLAIAIQKNYDAEKIEQIYNELLDYNYIQVYSFIYFFFRNFMSGSKKKVKLSSRLKKMFTINTHQKSKK